MAKSNQFLRELYINSDNLLLIPNLHFVVITKFSQTSVGVCFYFVTLASHI